MRHWSFMLFTLLFLSAGKVQKKAKPVKLQMKEINISAQPKKEQLVPEKKIDILHIDLAVSFDWKNHYCLGEETINFTPYFYDLKDLSFDAKYIDIEKLSLRKKNGAIIATKYINEGGTLLITPTQTILAKDTCQLYIKYKAKPDEGQLGGSKAISGDKGLYFINTDKKEPFKPTQLWTQGETEANSHWFITVDKPHEKSTFNLHITVADTLNVLSNGELIRITTNENDKEKTYHWKVKKQMSSYLVMMAVGQFEKTTDTWNNKEVSYFLEKKYNPYSRGIFSNTVEMLDFYSKKLGVSYPWEKYTQVVVHDFVSGAMENTSATLHGEFVHKNERELLDNNNEGIVSHELFHQWFGDLVTCDAWSHLTLNEGFATFGEQLWLEHKYGQHATDVKIYKSMQSYLRYSKFNDKPLINFYYKEKDDMFNAITYQKGARVLNLLRTTLGEEAFFAGTKNYLEKNAYQSVQIDDYRRAMEQTTGKDLRPFFNQWYMRGGHPILQIDTVSNEVGTSIRITQTQEPLFEFDLDLYFSTPAGSEVRTVHIKQKETRTTFSNSVGDYVFPDPFGLFIGEIKQEESTEMLKNKYSAARNYFMKIRTLKSIYAKEKTLDIDDDFLLKVLKDTMPEIVTYAIDRTDWKQEETRAKAENTIFNLAKSASDNVLKAKAIEILGDYKKTLLIDEFTNWSEHRSYSVAGAGLLGLYKINKDIALRQAEKLASDVEGDLLMAVAEVYAQGGEAEKEKFFAYHIPRFFNSQRAGLLSKYAVWAKRFPEGKYWATAKKYAAQDDSRVVRLNALLNLYMMAQELKNEDKTQEVMDIISLEKDERIIKNLKLNKIIKDDTTDE